MSESENYSAISFERIVFFSDAVFAIVITLLVLEIKVPHLEHYSEESIQSALFHLLPKFLGFAVSFIIVGMLWIEHHRIFQYIRHYDAGLMWRNLVFLLFVAFVPFPTALFSEYVGSKTAFILYTLSFALAAVMKWWVWAHAAGNKEKILPPEMDDELIKRISRRSWAVPLGCFVCIALAFFLPISLSVIGFMLIPLFAYLLYPGKKKVAADA
jgi:uncharacterized membrane protein